MMQSMKEPFPKIPERIAGLGDLAFNLWWSWHPAARMLFKVLDRLAWKESIHNPVLMLRELPQDVLESAALDQEYLERYDDVMKRFHETMETKACWFANNITGTDCLPIGYFSAEYGLHHSLPFYAGGLGFLAGDHIKECSDLGVPVIAIGFMYPEGYFRQRIRVDGWQEDVSETLNREAAPIMKVMNDKGEHLTVRVPMCDPPIYVAVWKVAVGRVPLYLMDTDIEMNTPWNREISSRLYTGDLEHRLLQEIVLGIGGSEVLGSLGFQDYVLHLNEGHTAFALLERLRKRIEMGSSFEEAVQYVRTTSIFTTHTPVPAGHDVFPFHLMEKYFSNYCSLLKLDRDSFLEFGMNPEEQNPGFNMAAFALRMTEHHNGVSKKHGEVARKMWHSLWPEVSEEKIPIESITNGVHVPTWVEPKVELMYNRYLGKDWIERHDDPETWKAIDTIPDQELWEVYLWLKIKLVNAVRDLARRRWTDEKANPLNIVAGGTLLDPMTLTIGFARRFATYKRAYLVFQNMDRLKKILTQRWRPVQIIFAGKAHPADEGGKRIIQQVFQIASNPDLGGRIAFVENYDEQLAQYLVHGVDLWLNNPIPPMEASGTSGMKASLNGVPQLSILDGWWIEGYNGKNGWAFQGTGSDEKDANVIYDILEKDVIPTYYRVDENGIPREWVKIMKEAIKSTSAPFSARRMVKEYTHKVYKHALKKASQR